MLSCNPIEDGIQPGTAELSASGGFNRGAFFIETYNLMGVIYDPVPMTLMYPIKYPIISNYRLTVAD
jgi:hypothetical protein